MAKREKRGLRPVQDIVGRIRFDAAFDARRFVVGYEERFSGVREAPLTELVASDNEIPWHRIVHIKAGELVVWDRRARIDLVFGSGDSPAADHPAIARACAPTPAPPAPSRRRTARQGPAEFVARPCFRFDPLRGAWVEAPGAAEVRVESLQVATYNVLFDLYEAERIYTEERTAVCLELLRERDADIIALQEVTPALWAALLAAPWLRAGYYVSEGPGAEGLAPYGQVLLSRWPLALELHEFSPRKRLVVGQLRLAGRRLAVAAVHLTSNHRDDANARRAAQLAVLSERLSRADVDDALVLGDLNFGDSESGEDEPLVRAGFVDAWRAVHPREPGFTFDPAVNPLAALISRTGFSARLDRVWVRSPAGALAPIDVTMFGDRSFGTGPDGQPKFASDHFGLCALLQVHEDAGASARRAHLAELTPVHESALAVIPPAATWPTIEAIRAAHDPSHGRWMPHINLVYGFVPEPEFAAAAPALEQAVRGLLPLRLTLGELRRFDHRGSTTVWLAPIDDPPGSLAALQAAAAALFPRCDEQSTRGGAFVPHLTIARLTGSEAEIAAAIARWQASWRPISFEVAAIHLISRRGDTRFEVRVSVPPGTNRHVLKDTYVAPLPPWAVLPSPTHARVAAAVARACAGALGEGGPCLHVVGSARLGVARPDGDLDLVFAGPDAYDRAELFTEVARRLADEGALTGVRTASSAGLPVLKCSFEGIAVDLQYAGLPPPLYGRDLSGLAPDELATLDPDSRRAALGCLDADALACVAAERVDLEVFQATLAEVRRWARARQLDAGAWGLLGGYTWALLVSWAAREATDAATTGPDALLRWFFAVLAAREPGLPIALGAPPPSPPSRRAPWPIYTPTPPAFNSARGLTRSTLALLHDELRRAHSSLSREDPRWDEPVQPSAQPRRLELTLHAAEAEAEACTGWLEGQVLGLILALEQAGARVRPYPRPQRGADSSTWIVGLDGGEAPSLEAAALAFTRGFAAWPARPERAELTARILT